MTTTIIPSKGLSCRVVEVAVGRLCGKCACAGLAVDSLSLSLRLVVVLWKEAALPAASIALESTAIGLSKTSPRPLQSSVAPTSRLPVSHTGKRCPCI
jgi:hypothetical protein